MATLELSVLLTLIRLMDALKDLVQQLLAGEGECHVRHSMWWRGDRPTAL